jgi:transposase
MKASYSHLGIDVSKATLDLHVHQPAQAKAFPNDARGHRDLIAFLAPLRPQRIALEASGGYEKPIIAALARAGLPVCCVQPQQVRHFARSLNLKAKTDAIDARLLARFAHDRADLKPIASVDRDLEALRQLVVRRNQLVEQQTMEKNRLAQAAHKLVRASIARSLTRLQKEIALIRKQTDALIAARDALAAKAQCVAQTKGIGPVTTAVLVACLPELGRSTSRRLNGLVGVAPYDDTSGQLARPKRIAGGRAVVRNALYMACLGASVNNPVIRAYYQRLRGNGLPHKSSMMACIRMMLSHLNKRVAQLQPTPIIT